MLKWAAQSLESLDQIAARAKDTHPQGSDDGTELYFPVDEEEAFLFVNDANIFHSTSTLETQAQSSQDDDQGPPTESTIYKSKFSAPTIRVTQELRSQRLDREARELGWDQEDLKAEYDANLEKLQAQENLLLASEETRGERQQQYHLQLAIFAQELANLEEEHHANSQALAAEKAGLESTQAEGKQRTNALAAELQEYETTIASSNMQAQHCAAQALAENELRSELSTVVSGLSEDAGGLRAALQEAETSGTASTSHDSAKEWEEREETELAGMRKRVADQEVAVTQLEQQLAQRASRGSRGPSEAMWIGEMEDRLLSLKDQMAAKQLQAEQLTGNKRALELRLEQLEAQKRKIQRRSAKGSQDERRGSKTATTPRNHSSSAPKSKIELDDEKDRWVAQRHLEGRVNGRPMGRL